MKIYFIFDGNKHEGPFSIEELQAKGIKRDTFVWKEGLPDWVHAEKVEELEYILPAPIPAPQPPTPPAFTPADPVAEEKAAVTETENKAAEQDQGARLIIEEPKKAATTKFAVAEEDKNVKQATSARVTSKAPKKRSNAPVFVILAIVVLGAGGYYIYSQQQKGAVKEKTGTQTTTPNPSLLTHDSAGTINDADATAATNTETAGTISATDDATTRAEEKSKVPENKDKQVKTDPKTNTTTAKTDTKKTETTEAKQKTNETAKDKEAVAQKPANPMDNLSVSGSYKKNIFGEGVMEGKIQNNNADVKFSKIVIEATYINSAGAVIRSEQFTRNGGLKANDHESFKFKINPPKDLKSVTYRIVSAQ